MQIVIDLPEERFRDIQRIAEVQHESNHFKTAEQIVANGTPLPKGHGRLIDADEAIKTLKSLGNRDYRREKGTIQEAEKMLSYDDYTPTIIEADTESETI